MHVQKLLKDIFNFTSALYFSSYTTSSESAGGVPGGIHAAPLSPANKHRASASRSVDSKLMCPLSSLINFNKVSNSICSSMILLLCRLSKATHIYKWKCSERLWLHNTSQSLMTFSNSNSLIDDSSKCQPNALIQIHLSVIPTFDAVLGFDNF